MPPEVVVSMDLLKPPPSAIAQVGNLLDERLRPSRSSFQTTSESPDCTSARACTGRAALALDPELSRLPEDVLRGKATKLADAEPGVEQGPDDEPLGGRLAGVGQMIRFFGGERLSHVLIRHLPPRNCASLGLGHAPTALSNFQAICIA